MEDSPTMIFDFYTAKSECGGGRHKYTYYGAVVGNLMFGQDVYIYFTFLYRGYCFLPSNYFLILVGIELFILIIYCRVTSEVSESGRGSHR